MLAGRLMFRHLLAVATVMAFAFLAAGTGVARATVFYAHHEDAVDHPADPSRDIKTFDTAFDNATGRWVTSVDFYGPPTAATSAKMYITVNLVQGGALTANPFTTPADDTFFYDHGRTELMGSKTFSDGGRRMTLEVTDPATIGLTPSVL